MNEIKQVCVYSASSTKIDEVFFADARRLGQLMANRGIGLINGAGKMGSMRSWQKRAIPSELSPVSWWNRGGSTKE